MRGQSGCCPAVPQKTQGPTWVSTHQNTISAKREMDLLILAIIAEKLVPRCWVQSLAVHLGNCYCQPLQRVCNELCSQQPSPGKS